MHCFYMTSKTAFETEKQSEQTSPPREEEYQDPRGKQLVEKKFHLENKGVFKNNQKTAYRRAIDLRRI